MNDKEVINCINKYYDECNCLNCAIWNTAAQSFGKTAMCEECFKMHYVDPEEDVSRLGFLLQIEWKSKEELLEMYLE